MRLVLVRISAIGSDITLHNAWRPVWCRDDEQDAEFPGADPTPARVLGGARLRDPAALRRRDGSRHVPPGDDAPGTRAEAVAGRVRPAEPAADGRALRREPEPAGAL